MGLFNIFTSQPPDEDRGDSENKDRESKDKLTRSGQIEAHQPPKFAKVSVLEAAGVGQEQRERVERTLELLRSLPVETPAAVRKSIVEASLKAFDISIKAIVEAASSELTAFDAYVSSGHKKLAELKGESEKRIAELEAEIGKIRNRLELATSDQAALDHATLEEAARVRPILGFFAAASANTGKVANDANNDHPPSIIVDESLTRTG
jgi:hypothetical protein